MSDILINERDFFISRGKSFKKFIKEVEQSKVSNSNHDVVNKVVKNEISKIRKILDKNNGWSKLTN